MAYMTTEAKLGRKFGYPHPGLGKEAASLLKTKDGLVSLLKTSPSTKRKARLPERSEASSSGEKCTRKWLGERRDDGGTPATGIQRGRVPGLRYLEAQTDQPVAFAISGPPAPQDICWP